MSVPGGRYIDFSIAADQARVRWAVKRNIRSIQRRRQVAESRIHGDHSRSACQRLSDAIQLHARQNVHIIKPCRQAFGPRFFMGSAPREFDTQPRVCQQADQFAPVRFRPVLVIAGCRVKENQIRIAFLR